MNNTMFSKLGRYNKASAAAVSQAIVQVVAAFTPLDPELEQAVGVVLTALLVWLVPNSPAADQPGGRTAATLDGSVIAHLPLPALLAAASFALFLAACSLLATGDELVDRVIGRDCGPESRALRAHLIADGLERHYPHLEMAAIREGAQLMAAAAEQGTPIELPALAFQAAVAEVVAPLLLAAGIEGEPIWLGLADLPPLAAEMLQIRRILAATCAREIA